MSRDNSVGIETGYLLDDGGVKNFLFSKSFRPALESPLTSYPMGTEGFFPGKKRPGREGDHSPPPSAEVKKIWIYISTPP
jgi:hypothetical protein